MASVLLGLQVATVSSPFTVADDHPLAAYAGQTLTDPFEILIVWADGSSFLLLAQDPSLSQAPERFGSLDRAAYRAQRIVPAAVTWALGGSARALGLVVIMGFAAIAAALARLLPSARATLVGAAVVANPASVATLEWMSSESVANAFGLWGLVAWRDGRRTCAATLWALGVLCRDTALVYPVTVVAASVLKSVRRRVRLDAAALGALAAVGVAYVGWASVVRIRIGAWPWGGNEAIGNLSLVPFAPLFRGYFGVLDAGPARGLCVVALFVVALVAVSRSSSMVGAMSGVVWTHVLVLALLGDVVWARWDYFGRLLVVPVAVAVLALLESAGSLAGSRQNIRSSRGAAVPIVSGA